MVKLKILSAGAVEGPLRALAPQFERESGFETDVAFNTVGALKERFVSGEHADVLILSTSAIDVLEREDRFVPGSRMDVGKAACGVAVRDGMLAPDISTPDKFTRMLRHAGSIAVNNPAHGGSSGIYFADLLKRIGMDDEIRPKLLMCKTGREVALAVVGCHAEVGITFTSEFMPIAGARVIGPLPEAYAYVNGYAAAISKNAALDGARTFLTFLGSPAARDEFRAFALE